MVPTLEILLIDDREENRNAARTFFNTQNDLKVDYASDYQEGLKKLNEKIYDGAIIDVQMPDKIGGQVEELGRLLGREAEELGIPFVFLTSISYEHNGTRYGSGIYFDEFCLNNRSGKITAEKTNSRAWADAYSQLKSLLTNAEITRRAKERYLKTTGKFYRQKLIETKEELKGGN